MEEMMLNWCSKHELFEICPECMREMREARELREWCLRMAKIEGDTEITAGVPTSDRPAVKEIIE
jgi:hypothetical protein